jgi:hypothetical protein
MRFFFRVARLSRATHTVPHGLSHAVGWFRERIPRRRSLNYEFQCGSFECFAALETVRARATTLSSTVKHKSAWAVDPPNREPGERPKKPTAPERRPDSMTRPHLLSMHAKLSPESAGQLGDSCLRISWIALSTSRRVSVCPTPAPRAHILSIPQPTCPQGRDPLIHFQGLARPPTHSLEFLVSRRVKRHHPKRLDSYDARGARRVCPESCTHRCKEATMSPGADEVTMWAEPTPRNLRRVNPQASHGKQARARRQKETQKPLGEKKIKREKRNLGAGWGLLCLFP